MMMMDQYTKLKRLLKSHKKVFAPAPMSRG
jgi:hypothetical protein